MQEEAVFSPFAFRIALAVMCAACLTAPVLAQGSQESRSVHLRNDCRLAAQTLQKGHPAPMSDSALLKISFCHETGGPTLQTLGKIPTADCLALEQLVAASAGLLDQRGYVGVMAAARNTSAPRNVRLAALCVLSAFISDTTKITQDMLAQMPDSGVTRLSSVRSGGLGRTTGSQSLTRSAPADMRALFAALSQADPDPVIRRAGRDLQRWFSLH